MIISCTATSIISALKSRSYIGTGTFTCEIHEELMHILYNVCMFVLHCCVFIFLSQHIPHPDNTAETRKVGEELEETAGNYQCIIRLSSVLTGWVFKLVLISELAFRDDKNLKEWREQKCFCVPLEWCSSKSKRCPTSAVAKIGGNNSHLTATGRTKRRRRRTRERELCIHKRTHTLQNHVSQFRSKIVNRLAKEHSTPLQTFGSNMPVILKTGKPRSEYNTEISRQAKRYGNIFEPRTGRSGHSRNLIFTRGHPAKSCALL